MSSQSVCGSPGFTDTLTSSMLRSGQMGSFTWMFSGKYAPCVGFTFSAGRSIAMPSRPASMFTHE